MTRLKAALLAAAVTAGLPAMAMAQERPDREDHQRSEGPREQREAQGARPDRAAPQPAQPAQAPQPARQPQPNQGEVRAQQVQQQQVQQAQAQNQRRGQDRGNFNGDPRTERAQSFNGGGYNNGARGYDPRQNGNRGYEGRPGDDRGRDIRTEQYRGNDRFGGGVRGNDWRQDRRYDWQGYRSQHRDLFRAPRYVAPRNWSYGYRRFEIGFRLPSFFFGEQYWIADPYAYRLPPAYGPYRWVRYYDDVLLVDLRTGQVVDEIPGFFY